MLPDNHIHTSTCWQETHEIACMEHRILELEERLLAVQVALRAVGGTLDKVETSVTKVLQAPEKKYNNLKENRQ